MGECTVVTRDQVVAALEAVNDPHIPVSLRRMHMLESVVIGDAPPGESDGTGEGAYVEVRVRIPCTGCPGAGMLRDAVRGAVRAIPGVAGVEVVESWDPWDRDKVDPVARNLMRDNGIQI